ncbi:MAG TPA: hypothetical protein VF006_33535 [Longimicrobium sp.]
MGTLALRVECLAVESFRTAGEDRVRGTAAGQGFACPAETPACNVC